MSVHLSKTVFVAALSLLAVVLLTSCGDDDAAGTPTGDPTAWVAVSPRGAVGQTGPIVIFEASNPTATTTVGTDSHYVGLCWSPDGTRLAATELRDKSLRFVVFDRAHPAAPAVDIPGEWMDYAWSPDSNRILALSRTELQVLDTSGKRVGAVALPARADGGMSIAGMGYRTWAPDSRRAAVFVNEHLVLIDRDGHGEAVDPAASGLGIGGAGFQFIGWTDSTHLTGSYAKPIYPALTGTPPPPERNFVDITANGDKLAWKLSPFDPVHFLSLLPAGSDAVATALGSRLVFQWTTADGSAILTAADSAGGGQPSFAYWIAGQPHELDLSQFDLDSRIPGLRARAIDVVLVLR